MILRDSCRPAINLYIYMKIETYFNRLPTLQKKLRKGCKPLNEDLIKFFFTEIYFETMYI